MTPRMSRKALARAGVVLPAGTRVVTEATRHNLPVPKAAGAKVAKRKWTPKEFAEQALFAKWCEVRLAPLGHAFTATMTGINLPIRTAVLAKRKGVRKGAPDWMLWAVGAPFGITRFEGLALEFKAPDGTGRPTHEQLAWEEALMRVGWFVAYPTTAQEAERTVADYLGIPR